MNVDVLGRDTSEWDGFVSSRADASFYHLSAWRTLFEQYFGHSTAYLIARADGRVAGILPLVRLRSRIFGSSLVSLPYFCSGGVVAGDPTAAAALIERAEVLRREFGAKVLMVRHQGPELPSLHRDTSKAHFLVHLEKDPDGVFGRFKAPVRRRIRKALKSGVDAVWGSRCLPEFYRVYARNMRDLGVPIHAKSFYEAVVDGFPDHAKVFLVRLGDKTLAAQLLFTFKDRVLLACAASLREHLSLSPNNLLYWEAIRYGCEQGYGYCDLGRSTIGTGPYNFKKQWGAEERTYTTYFHSARDAASLESADSGRYRMFRNVWRRLPVSMTSVVGPRIVRALP